MSRADNAVALGRAGGAEMSFGLLVFALQAARGAVRNGR